MIHVGRLSRYETYVEPHLDKIEKWVQLISEEEIAKKLGIAYSTFQKYKREYPALNEALKNGKQTLILDLKDSLKKKAKGFYYEETKIREVTTGRPGKEVTTKVKDVIRRYAQPDTGAIHLLLKNLDPEWRNDDQQTMDMKREKLEIEKERNW